MICQYGDGGLLSQLIQFSLRCLPPLIRLPLFGRRGQALAQFLLRRSSFMYRTFFKFEVSKKASNSWCATVCRPG